MLQTCVFNSRLTLIFSRNTMLICPQRVSSLAWLNTWLQGPLYQWWVALLIYRVLLLENLFENYLSILIPDSQQTVAIEAC